MILVFYLQIVLYYRYVAVAKCNIVLIYKIGINRYNCCMALAMNGDVILKTRKYVRR